MAVPSQSIPGVSFLKFTTNEPVPPQSFSPNPPDLRTFRTPRRTRCRAGRTCQGIRIPNSLGRGWHPQPNHRSGHSLQHPGPSPGVVASLESSGLWPENRGRWTMMDSFGLYGGREASSNRCLTGSNRCLTSSNKKLVWGEKSFFVEKWRQVATRMSPEVHISSG